MSRVHLHPAVSRVTRTCAGLSLAAFLSLPLAAQTKSPLDTEKAEQAYMAGVRLLDRHEFAAAQDQFARAAKLAPTRGDYSMAVDLTRQHRVSELIQQAAKARMTNQPQQAETLFAEAKAIDPASELVLEHSLDAQSTVTTQPKAVITPPHDKLFAPPIQLLPTSAPQNLDLRGSASSVLEQAARAFGIKAVIDPSVTAESTPQVRCALDGLNYDQTMKILSRMTHTFGVAIDSRTVLIARDTQEERARLERQVEETIYVPGSTPEQLNELSNIIKNVFDVKQVVIGAGSGTIGVRAPQATLTALNETLDDLIDGASEIMLELKLITVDKTHVVNTGVSYPSSVGAFSVAQEANTIVSSNQSLVNELISSGAYVPNSNLTAEQNTILEALELVLSGAVADAKVSGLIALAGNGLGLTGIYLSSGATINFDLTASDTRALDDVNVRVGDHQTTTLRIGERYPITTATYSSGVSSSTAAALKGVTINGVSASTLLNQYLGGASSQTIPQVQYEDLGITLKTTPSILRSGLVNVAVDMKIEALAGGSANGIPVLSSQVYTSDITIPDGGTAIMFSDLSTTQSAALSGLPGLGELPGFQETIGASDSRDLAHSELVLEVTPHVVRHRKNLLASRRIPFSTSVPQDY